MRMWVPTVVAVGDLGGGDVSGDLVFLLASFPRSVAGHLAPCGLNCAQCGRQIVALVVANGAGEKEQLPAIVLVGAHGFFHLSSATSAQD